MSKFSNKIKDNFTITPNHIIRNAEVSWKAKGIFLYMASKPNDWNYNMNEIKQNATDGIKSLRSGLKELEEHGYLIRNKDRKSGGKWEWEWILTSPELENKSTKSNHMPENGIPLKGVPLKDIPLRGTSNKKDYTKKESTNKDFIKKEDNLDSQEIKKDWDLAEELSRGSFSRNKKVWE